MSQKKIHNDKKLSKDKRLAIIGIAIAVYALLTVAPFTGPYFQYPLHMVRCMNLPVIASTYSESYNAPGEPYYSVSPLTNRFFCSVEEAKTAGFHRNKLLE